MNEDDKIALSLIQRELGVVVTTIQHFGKMIEKLDLKLEEKFMSKEAAARLDDKIVRNEKRINALESTLVWLVRTIIGSFVTVIVAAIVYLIKT